MFWILAMTHISISFSCARWLTDYFSRHEIQNISRLSPKCRKPFSNRFKGNKVIKRFDIHVIQLCIRIVPVNSTRNMQLYAGKRQRIGPHLYPFSTTDLTITKTFSTFNDYRYFCRLLCILKKNSITKKDGIRNFEMCHC